MRRSVFVASAAAAAAFPVRGNAAPSGFAPFDNRTPIPVVRVRAGERELRFAIDTGNDLSTISAAAADALSLPRAAPASASPPQATLSGLTVAGATLRPHTALVTGVGSWAGLTGFPVDGSLGYEAFGDRAITLDYVKRRLTFPETAPDGERTAITWLRYGDGSPRVVTFEALMIDGFPATAQFDTAMSKNAIIFITKLTDVLIDNAPNAPRYDYAGTSLSPGRVGSIRLGTTTLASPVVVYQADASAHVPTSAIAVVVGDGLFAKRAVTLDFPGSTLIIS
jgi:Aspartyl protease